MFNGMAIMNGEIIKKMFFGTIEYHHHQIPSSMVGVFGIIHSITH